jgi:tetratricopeptide (TPR) repeat protein/transcriptional regulator with XRE-family HTH domain
MPASQQQHHSFGEVVRRRRRGLELTQQQLAQQVSCSEDMVRKIEADLRRPSRWLAERLLKHLQIEAADQPAFLKAARLGSSVPPGATAAPAEPAAPAAAVSVVGRSKEMDLLRERIAAARQGRGSLVLIEGEPGIGKSHLAQAALAEAEAGGFLTCAAACYEIDRAIPLQPLVDWTHRMLDLLGPQVIDELSPLTQCELAELLPLVRELRPALQPAAGAPELRRARIFGAFVELTFARLQTAPMLIVLDDIHWADEMTLPLLHHLVRQARSQRLVVVCTLRSEELGGNEALALFAQSAETGLGALRLALGRLSADDVSSLLDAQGLARGPEFAQRLFRSSEGHPLYLTSMLQQLRENGASADATPTLPPALRDSIRERLRRLPARPRAILDIAAVLGRRFDFFALERGAGIAGGSLAEAVDLLVQRRLLHEIDDGSSFDFAHDKIREVVYGDLGSAKRIVLHRRAAEALMASEGDNDAVIAEHCELAGQWEPAVRHYEQAARRSLELSALNEAGRSVERALALAQAHPAAADAAMRVRLQERIGDVHAQDGRSAEAVSAFEAALDAVRTHGDATWTRDLLTKLGMAYRRADDYVRARASLGESLAASRRLGQAHHVADTLYHLGTVAWSDGDNSLALHCHGEAVQLCEAHALQGLVAVQAWHGEGEARFTNAEPGLAIERYSRSLELARRIGDRGYEAENLMMIGWACSGSMGLADYARAEDHASQGLAIAESNEQKWHLAPLHVLQADAWRCLGRTEPALELLNVEVRRTERAEQARFGIIVRDALGRLLHEQGRYAEAEECFRRALESGARHSVNFWRAQVLSGAALARVYAGLSFDVPALHSECEAALARSDRCGHARCLEALAEAALHSADAAGAHDAAGRLLAMAERSGLREQAALAHWLIGRAWLREAPREAETALASALAAAESLGRPWLAWQVRSAMAEQCERGRRHRRAAEHRTAAAAWRERFSLPATAKTAVG